MQESRSDVGNGATGKAFLGSCTLHMQVAGKFPKPERGGPVAIASPPPIPPPDIGSGALGVSSTLAVRRSGMPERIGEAALSAWSRPAGQSART